MVTFGDRDFYLGKWNTKASRAEYDRLVQEWLAPGRRLPSGDANLNVAEPGLRFWDFAKRCYRKDGRPAEPPERAV